MPFDFSTRPIRGHRAFAGTSDNHLLSQAAILLSIGRTLRAEGAVREFRGRTTDERASLAEDSHSFATPYVQNDGRRIQRGESRFLWDKHRASSAGLRATSDGSGEVNALTLAAKSVYSTPSVKNAVVLMEGALQHESPIVKVAAAHAFLAISANPAGLVETLVSGLRDNDRLTREIAATALARFDPSHPALTGFIRPDGRDRPGFSPSHTSLIVHGTWARSEDWWQPRIGDFHTYIRTNVCPDVYSAADRYDWTGGYSDAARATAATELTNWLNAHQLERPTVFAHSHGGNVAMLASHSGLKMDTLVLLSCPAHIPKYSPNLANINKVLSVRVKMDLVILVDGGAQSFPPQTQIDEHYLDVWFDHSASHDPEVWTRNRVEDWL